MQAFRASNVSNSPSERKVIEEQETMERGLNENDRPNENDCPNKNDRPNKRIKLETPEEPVCSLTYSPAPPTRLEIAYDDVVE